MAVLIGLFEWTVSGIGSVWAFYTTFCFYREGDISRAIFWLMVTALLGKWLGANLKGLVALFPDN